MHAEPFVCYRPRPERAQDFASLPYDVFTKEEAREAVARRPRSFLAIDRPETAFDPSHDMHAPDVYEKAASLLADRVGDGSLVRDGDPCYYLYRLSGDGHEQTGIVAAFSIDDYESGVIRRHEFTRPVDEKDRADHIAATGCQTGPVLLAYRDDPTLSTIVSAGTTATPLYDFTDAEGWRETVWRVSRPAAVDALRTMLELVPRSYIADGHHRAAAAARVRKTLRESHGDTMGAPGTEPCDRLLAVLFPESQLMTLPYDRVVAGTAGLAPDALLAELADRGFAVGGPTDKPIRPTEALRFGLYLGGSWRELAWEGGVPQAAVDRLDVSILQDQVLGPILGITDPGRDPRIRFVGGHVDAGVLEPLAGENGLAFALRATPVGDMMAVADEGGIMPPKSTWFEPKLRSGLFIRPIRTGAERPLE
jgi:uncharacterized protein (DUF1015 family)